MAIVKRFNKLLGLEKIDVLVDEKDKSRHIIISDMPESLPQGKSSFLIEVSPYMRKGIELQIDFIDSKGNSIYVEPVSNYLEGTSRTVSVEVYNTVAPGVATMIIVGELESIPLDAGNFSDTQEIPDDFKGVYNVRLAKEVIINTAEINVQPIKFYSSPRLTAVEKRFGTMEREVVSGETISSAFSISGKPTQQEEFSIFTSNESEIDSLGAGVTEIDEVPRPPDGNIKGDKADIERLKRSSKKRSVRTNSRFKRSKRIRRRRSPEEYPYVFTINDSNHEFTTEEIGGEIKFSNIRNIYDTNQLDEAGLDSSISFNVVSDTNDENFPTHYTASIAKLENNKTAFVNTPFTKQDKNGNYRLLPMEATAKVHYTKEPTASYSVTNIVSYADVTLSHLRTFSGEVFKAKVYVKAEGSQDDYKLLAEVPIESPELMIDTNSVGIGERTGVITDDEDLNTNWEKFGGTNGLSTATSTTTASYDNSGSLDSVMISGSISSFTDQIRFQQKDAYKFNLTKGIDYDLSFNAVGEKGTDGRALLMVYVSGSALKQKDNLHFDEKEGLDIIEPFQYGKRMGVLEIEAGDDVKKQFGLIRHNFNSNSTGDAKVQFRIISGKWNLFDISVVPSTDTGFSPSFVNFQQELPPELTHKRPEKLEFLTEFYDINNNSADEIAVTTGSTFTGGNMVITGDDNVLSHNLFIGGDTTGSGIHMGGTSSTLPDDNYSEGATGSGFIRSLGYLGFESASNSALGGKKGFMIYSGSVLPNSGEDYKGVGLELVGASGSLKFRTSPSVFDVQADSFFVGKTTSQFISGSGEKIEISSSNFHLDNAGNVDMTGTITAQAGNIGGFNIEDSRLTAGTGNSSVTMSGADQLFRFGSGSAFDTTAVDGILFGKDTDGKYKFAIGKGTSYILFDGSSVNIRSEDINVTASVFSIDVDVFKLSSNNLFISSSDGGFISAGNPRPSGITGTSKGIFINGRDPSDTKPKFLVGAANGNRISFDGDNIFMSSSGFFLGSSAQFVSGSDGNIEISSSNFHLDNGGNVIMSGKVTANEGSIGGFNITNDALSSANFLISGSSTGNNFFISSSNFNVKASGDVTASALDLTGGAVGGINVSEGEISVGSVLKLKDSGQITGSSVLFTGGKIGGFTIDADEIKSTNVLIDSANEKITLGSANAIKLQGGATDNFLTMGSKTSFSHEGTGTAGILIGMDGTNPQAEFVKDSSNYFIFDDGIDIQTDTLVASGSSITLETPKFFLGKTSTNFISGSNGNIEISSSKFHLTKEGNVTGSSILLGNKGSGQFLQFVNNTLTVQGAITADSIAVPSAAPTPSSSIASTGLLTTVSASIGGFDITSAEIKDKDNNLRLKSSGQITGSNVLFNGGTIGGFTIDADEIKSGTNIALDSTNKKLTINNATFGNAGIQLEYNSGTPRFYVGDGSNEFVKYDGSSVDIRTKKLNASGSNITLETPKFFLGKKTNQFVSGSNGNIEISSSNFHLTPQGNVTMSGEITAAGGTIGGFIIGDELTSTAGTLILRGASGIVTASNAKITGDITANTITANVAGTIGNFSINSVGIKSSNSNLILSASGQITASDAKITGDITANTITANTAGTIANFNINSTEIASSNNNLRLKASGQITASDALLNGTINVTGTGTIAGWTIASDRFNSSDDNFRINSAGSITIKNHSFGQSGFQIVENSGTTQFYVGTGTNRFIKFDGSDVDIGTEKLTASGSSINLGAPSFRLGSASNFISGSGGTLLIQNSGTTTLSGSAVTIETPKFFLGKKGSQFVSGSNNLIEISSSKFHLKNNGDVIMNNITASNANVSGKMTATSGEIGGFTIGDDLSNSAGNTLKLKGSSGQITASAAQITGDITANTITANTAGTIANFNINSTEIASSNNNLRLKANGQITASAANIQGKITATSGQIAGFGISGNTLTATNFTLDASGKSISLGDASTTDIIIADADTGIQLGHATFGSAPFSVTKAGVLKATSGTIGGWTLSGTQISSNNLIMDSAGVIQTSDYASNTKGWRLSPANGGEAEFQNVKIRGTLSTAVFEKETVNAVGGQLYIANSTALTGSATIAATAATMSVANVGGFVANEVLSAKKVSATGFATEYMLVQSASRDFPSSETDFRGKLFVVRGYNSGSTGDSGSLGDVANTSQSFEPGQVIVSTGKIGTGFIRLNANPNDVTTPYIDIVERTGSGVYDVDLKARLGDLSGLSSGLLYGNASPGFGLFTENVFLQGAITATTGSFTGKVHVGTTDGIVIDGNAKKLFQGAGTHNDDDTGFYMDSTGKFSLGEKLVWDSSTETLTVTGTINITNGSGFATAASVSGSFPNATSVSASLNASSSALQSNINASSSALQTNINTVKTNVSGAFTSTSASLSSTIMTDANGKIVKTPSTSGLSGLILKSTHLGFASSGTFKSFIGSTGNFLFKNDDDNLISFGQSTSVGDGTTTSNLVLKAANAYLSGSSINLLTSRFLFGDSSNFISGSNGDLRIFSTGDTTLSGSSVTLETPKFFLGKKGSQFVSGSNNLIEISSSKFHLKNDGNVIMNQITASDANISGKITTDDITATGGTIGGFNIGASSITSQAGGLTLNGTGGITGSKFLLQGGTITSDVTILGSLSAGSIATGPGGGSITAQITTEGFARFVSASIGGFNIDGTTISDTSNKLIMSSSGQITGSSVLFDGGKIGGFEISATQIKKGTKFILDTASNNGQLQLGDANSVSSNNAGVYINGDGDFAFVVDANNKLFNDGGFNLLTSKAVISGSSVQIKTPDFFLGKVGTQFISGSNNNIEITSSMFHLDPANNKVAISGSITATTGKIGGMLLENNKLRSQYGDGSVTTHTVIVNGSSKYEINGVQQPTLELKVGNTYRFDNSHSSNGGHPFRFATSADGTVYSTGVTVVGSEGSGGTAYVQIAVTADTPSTLYYRCTSHGSMGGQLNIITIGTLELNGVNGQITGSDVLISGGKISGSNLEINVPNVTMSGSSVDIRTPKFFLGGTGQFVSGSNNLIEISSSKFHLQSDGDVITNNITASNINASGKIVATTGTIGGFNIGTDLDASSGTLKLKGASGQITASAAKITGDIVANTITANTAGTIGQFTLNSVGLKSSDGALILSGSGQITASAAQITGKVTATSGVIGGWTVGSTLSATNILLDPATPKITLGSKGTLTDSNTGFYAGTDGIALGASSVFKVTSAGALTATSATVTGDITANTITANTAGTIGGFTLNSVGLKSSDGGLILSGSGQITASAAKLTSADVSGKITADSGEIGGFTIDADEIKSGDNIGLNSTTKALTINSTTFGNDGVQLEYNSGNPRFYVGNGSDRAFIFDGTNVHVSSSNFTLDGARGAVTASDILLSGNITATTINATGSGVIGGFTISSTQISDSNDDLILKSNGQITASAARLTGDLVATSIQSTSGSIGGWTIGGSTFTGGNATLNSSGNLTLGSSNDVVRLSADDSTYRLWTGHATAGSAPFRVHKDGTLTATGATITGNISITSGDLAGVSADTISGSVDAVSSSLAGRQTPFETQVVLSSGGMSLNKNDGTSLAEYGTITRIGLAAQEHISASSAGITIKDGATVRGTFVAGGVTIGNTSQGHVSMSTADVSIKKDANNFAKIDSDSFDIILNGQTTASFGGTTTIGSTVGRHLKLTGTALEIKTDANTTALSASAAGLEMSGKVVATEGEIGGFNVSGSRLLSTKIGVGDGGATVSSSVFMTPSIGLNAPLPAMGLHAKSGSLGSGFSIFAKNSSNQAGLDINIGEVSGFGVALADASSRGLRIINIKNPLTDSDTLDIIGNGGAYNSSFTSTSTNSGFRFSAVDDVVKFQVGKADGSHLKFSSADNLMYISSSNFFLGNSSTNFISGSGGNIEISSSKFHLQSTGDVTVSGKITSTEGTIGGWSMTTSSFFSGDTGDRMEFQSNNNRIVLYDAAKSSLAGQEIIQIGQLSSAGEIEFGSSVYGIKISGSNSSMGSNEAKLVAQMGDHGATATNFHYSSSVIQGYSKSRNPNNMYGGRAGIYGRSSFALSSIPAGYIGSLSSQKGIMAGIVGSHLNHGSGFYRKTAGILGVNNQNLLDDVGFPKKIATGSFGVVSVGPMYVTASTADHREDGIGYSILAGGGYVHVSASSAGDFGGNEYGVIIDSSNVQGQESALTFKTQTSGPTDYEYSMGLDGDGTFHLSKGTALGTNDILANNVSNSVLSIYGGYGSTGVSIYSSGILQSNSYGTFDKGLGVGTAGTTTVGLIRATNDVVAFYSSDKRLKKNRIRISDPIGKITQLNGYEFDWIPKEGIHENEGHDVGVIAQEVEKVIPEIVQTRDNGYKAVKYEKIVPLLIESIKEQQKQIDELKKEVEELKNA